LANLGKLGGYVMSDIISCDGICCVLMAYHAADAIENE
jgi:hypothetical protein